VQPRDNAHALQPPSCIGQMGKPDSELSSYIQCVENTNTRYLDKP